MNVCVIGTGYVGLVVGSCLAESGNDVICIDSDAEKVENLKQCNLPIYEPGLEEIVRRNVREARLTFTTEIDFAVKKSFVIFIAVGTPSTNDGAASIDAVLSVAREVARSINRYKVVVAKSTVPVGTTERIREAIRQETTQPFDVIANPEFLKEGAAVDDFMKPDRVVIGADDVRAAEFIRELYAPFVRTGSPVLIMDIRSAELTKYAANAFLATRISFMNEFAALCERVGADIEMIRKGLGTDARIGPAFLFPGVGFGGSCLPKDIRAVVETARNHNYSLRILQAVEAVNLDQRRHFVGKVFTHFGENLEAKRFAVWGLSFKPRTNDTREAPSIDIIEALLARGGQVTAHDPEATEEARKLWGSRVDFASNNYTCLEGVDALLLVTEWQAYRHPNFERMKSLMRQPIVFDGRNIYDPKQMRELGFVYYSIGRP